MTTPSDYFNDGTVFAYPILGDPVDYHDMRPPNPSDEEILREIKELCQGLALSDKARASRYDKIVEVLKANDRETDE